MEYSEANILSLAIGDEVIGADPRRRELRYRLGEFLNAGNASHVWGIQGRPDRALKLAFVASNVLGTNPTLASGELGREFMSDFVKEEPRFRRAIERAARRIREDDLTEVPVPEIVRIHAASADGSFAEVDRVYPEVDGLEWLTQLWRNEAGDRDQTRIPYPPGDAPTTGRAISLLTAIQGSLLSKAQKMRTRAATPRLSSPRRGSSSGIPRDEGRGTWVLLDWEAGLPDGIKKDR